MSTKRDTENKGQRRNGAGSGPPVRIAAGRTESITAADYAALVSSERSCRKLKYNNKPTVVDSLRFASRREATRYQDLKIRERFGLISDLRLQISHALIVNGVHIATYRSDFEYLEDGQRIVEDAKGVKTPSYRLKKKLMRAIYGIEIRET